MKKMVLGLLLVFGSMVLVSAQETERYRKLIAYENFVRGVYYYNSRAYSAAVDSFIKALEQNSEDIRARIWLGKAYYHAGYEQNAVSEWEKIIEQSGGTNLLRQKLNFIFFQRSLDKRFRLEMAYIPLRNVQAVQNNEFTFVHPVSVAMRSANELFIAGFSSGAVHVFDQNGNLKASIDRGKERIQKPYGMAFDKSGNLFVSDFGADKILVFNNKNEFKTSFGGFGLVPGKFSGPEGIFVDNNGNIFVVDSGNNRIQQFRINSNYDVSFIRTFGSRGAREGQFFRPVDVTVSKDGKIYVTDMGNSRIQVFDDSGNYLNQFGAGYLKKPRGLLFLDENNVLIADEQLGIVKYNIMESAWNVIRKRDNEEIFTPVGLFMDQHDLLYVADYSRQNLLIMIPEKLKYVNLQVSISQTFNADYPTVNHRIFVKDRMNKSIEGLDSTNFRVMDNGKPIEGFAVHQFTPPGDRMKIVIVNDRSVKMKKFNTELRELMDVFFKRLGTADMVKVINFGSGYRDMIPFMNQRLKPLEAMTEDNFQEQEEAGKALYTGITESFANDFKSRILLVTNGDLSDSAFAPYDIDGIMSYAKNNDIPVYVLCFGNGSRVHELKTLADRTGGSFIQANRSNDVYRLVDMMRAKKDISYFLSYNTQPASEFARQAWRTVRVDVNYKDLFGLDEGGYFIP